MLWGWLIAAGLLLARVACLDLDAGTVPAQAGVSEVTTLVLLTAGLLASLVGVTGFVGLLGWVPAGWSPKRDAMKK